MLDLADPAAPVLLTTLDTSLFGAPNSVSVHDGVVAAAVAMVQFIAARLAGVSRVVFHTVDAAGVAPCHAAIERLMPLVGRDVGATIAAIEAMKFMWSAPNGT